MSRTPVHIESALGLITGRDAVWKSIRILKVFTLGDIEIITSDNHDMAIVSSNRARPYIRGLEAAGYVTQTKAAEINKANGQQQSVQWKLTNDIGVDAPRVRSDGSKVTQGLTYEQMWRTMRILNSFGYADLVITASTDEISVTKNTAKDYIYNLHKAEYLALTSPAKTSGGIARYRLLPHMNTGPKPPMVQRIKQVFDANLNKVMWPKEGE